MCRIVCSSNRFLFGEKAIKILQWTNSLNPGQSKVLIQNKVLKDESSPCLVTGPWRTSIICKDWLVLHQACCPFFLDTQMDNISQPSLQLDEAMCLNSGQWNGNKADTPNFQTWTRKSSHSPCPILFPLLWLHVDECRELLTIAELQMDDVWVPGSPLEEAMILH